MPAYFSIELRYPGGTTGAGQLTKLCNALMKNDASFVKGYGKNSELPYHEIVKRNRTTLKGLLSGNVRKEELAFTQTLWRFGDLENVRMMPGFDSEENLLKVTLLVPEEDLAEFPDDGDEAVRHVDRMESLTDLVKKVWKKCPGLCVQTAWELSVPVTETADLLAGEEPKAEPFAIMRADMVRPAWKGEKVSLGRKYVLLVKEGNWHYS